MLLTRAVYVLAAVCVALCTCTVGSFGVSQTPRFYMATNRQLKAYICHTEVGVVYRTNQIACYHMVEN